MSRSWKVLEFQEVLIIAAGVRNYIYIYIHQGDAGMLQVLQYPSR
jgi:hypothetical protein